MPSEYEREEAKTLKAIIKFIDSDFARAKFTRTVYSGGGHCSGLMYQFGHIAHYNIFGFYDEWFDDDESRLEWLKHIFNTHAHTNIEKAVQEHVRASGLIPRYGAHIAAVQEVRERAELKRLTEKYGGAN